MLVAHRYREVLRSRIVLHSMPRNEILRSGTSGDVTAFSKSLSQESRSPKRHARYECLPTLTIARGSVDASNLHLLCAHHLSFRLPAFLLSLVADMRFQLLTIITAAAAAYAQGGSVTHRFHLYSSQS